MGKSIFIGLLIVMSAPTLAAEITVYRWVDEKNVVHFSQHQPSHDNYTELTMVEALKASAKKVAADPVEEPKQIAVAQSSTVKERFKQKCEEAQANVKTLKAFDNIQTTDADGTTRMLSKEEKKQQLTLSNKQVEVYCEGQ